MATYDTTALLADIRRRAHVPDATDEGAADSDLLALANAEQFSLMQLIQSVHNEYFLAEKDVALEAARADYEVPTRAMGASLREVQLLKASGTLCNLVRWRVEDLDGIDPTDTGTPEAFYLKGNRVWLYPVPTDSGDSLRLTYLRRPSRLVAVTAVEQITLITTGTIASVPGLSAGHGFSTSTPLDIVRSRPHFDPVYDSATPSAVDAVGDTVTFASTAVLADAEVDDYVCLAGETPVPQMPVEFWHILSQRVANTLMRDQGDLEALAAGVAALKEMEAAVLGVVSNRVEGEPEVLVDETFFPGRW